MRFAIALLRLFAHWPLPLVRALGAMLGAVLYRIGKERRRVTLINLALCFPHESEKSRTLMARAHFRVFAQSVLDRGLLWTAPAERVRKYVRWIGMEHFDAAKKRGAVILLAPHFVGLDAGGTLTGMTWPGVSMYSRQKNKAFDEFAHAGRSRFNEPVLLSRQDGVRAALRALKAGRPFYYLPDMDYGPRDAVFVPFFGVQAATVTALARLAKLSGALVVPCVSRLTPDGYRTTLYPAWEDYPGPDIEAATARMNAFIEARVLEMPEQYLWTHKRFKTRPPGEARFYK